MTGGMKIFVRAKPNAKNEKVEQIDETHFAVSVKEPPIENRANKAIIRALAGYFNVTPSRLLVVSGAKSRNKIIKVEREVKDGYN